VNGLLFEARSADSLAAAIVRFADLPLAERQKLGRAARRLAELRFDERHVTDTYVRSVIALTGKGG
jgi:glycosyltransferase involved in cell wall biosynthesis